MVTKLVMSHASYTVSLSAETAERLKTIAESQGLEAEAAIEAAIADYLAAWEQHAADLADEGREDLPWLNPGPSEE